MLERGYKLVTGGAMDPEREGTASHQGELGLGYSYGTSLIGYCDIGSRSYLDSKSN
jgi:hypothetical protein